MLLSLMNLVFETPAHERTIAFATIAERGRIGVEQVRRGGFDFHRRSWGVQSICRLSPHARPNAGLGQSIAMD